MIENSLSAKQIHLKSQMNVKSKAKWMQNWKSCSWLLNLLNQISFIFCVLHQIYFFPVNVWYVWRRKKIIFLFDCWAFFSIKKIINVFEFQISKLLNKYCGGKLKVPKADRLDVVSGDRILFKWNLFSF